jgi:hypothetical protein
MDNLIVFTAISFQVLSGAGALIGIGLLIGNKSINKLKVVSAVIVLILSFIGLEYIKSINVYKTLNENVACKGYFNKQCIELNKYERIGNGRNIFLGDYDLVTRSINHKTVKIYKKDHNGINK